MCSRKNIPQLIYLICAILLIGCNERKQYDKIADNLSTSHIFQDDFSINKYDWHQLSQGIYCTDTITQRLSYCGSKKENTFSMLLPIEQKVSIDSNYIYEISFSVSDSVFKIGFGISLSSTETYSVELTSSGYASIYTPNNKNEASIEKINHDHTNKDYVLKLTSINKKLSFFLNNNLIYRCSFKHAKTENKSSYTNFNINVGSENIHLNLIEINYLPTLPDKNYTSIIWDTNNQPTLSQVIKEVVSGDTILLNDTYLISKKNDIVAHGKRIVVQPLNNHTTISLDQNMREDKSTGSWFNVQGECAITFRNITFRDFYHFDSLGKGGVFYIESPKCSLIFENCRFINNIAYQGGAIYNNGHLKFQNCYFESNYAKDDGAVLYTKHYSHITNSIFINNQALNYNTKNNIECTSSEYDWIMIKTQPDVCDSYSDYGDLLYGNGGGALYINEYAYVSKAIFYKSDISGCVSSINNSVLTSSLPILKKDAYVEDNVFLISESDLKNLLFTDSNQAYSNKVENIILYLNDKGYEKYHLSLE